MLNIVIVLIIALLAAWGVRRMVIRSRKGGGCCGEHEAAEKRTGSADRNKKEYPYKVTLSIKGMTCRNCAAKVENALNALPGIWAAVHLSSGTASVRLKSEVDEAVLKQAVAGAGYLVTEIRQ